MTSQKLSSIGCCIGLPGGSGRVFEEDSGFQYLPTSQLIVSSSLHARDIAMSSTATSARVPPLPLNGKAFRHRQADSSSLASQPISYRSSSQNNVATNGNYFRNLPSSGNSTQTSASTSSATISSGPSNYATLQSTTSTSEVRYRTPSDARQIPVTPFRTRPSQIRQKDANGEYVLASAVKDFEGDENFNRGSKIYIRGTDPHDNDRVYVAMEVNGKPGAFFPAPKSCLQPIGPKAALIDASEITLKESIGKGSFSTVYKAIYKGQTVAYKKLRIQGEKGYEDACREAEHLNAMDHPNIVKVVGVCKQVEGSGNIRTISAALVMEYCAGGQLVDLIMGQDFHPPLRVLKNWALQIAHALWHMHSHPTIPICHGDVKPHNVLIVEKPCKCNDQLSCVEDPSRCRFCGLCRADHLTLKMTDFGLTRNTNEDTKNVSSNVPGSAPYVAPEMTTLQVVPASDVWSFGVVLWQLLTKQAPYAEFDVEHKDVLLFAIATQKIRLPFPEDIPEQLKDILEACWTFKPEDRPTMEKVIEMIEETQTLDDSQFVVKCDPAALQELIDAIKMEQRRFKHPEAKHKTKADKGKSKKPNEKLQIGPPENFQHTMSVSSYGNGYHIHKNDSEVNSPFSTLQKKKTIGFHKSTPELSFTAASEETITTPSGQHTLERTKAFRRRQPLHQREESIVTETLFSKGFKKTSLGIPTDAAANEPHYDETTIEVVAEKDVPSTISSRTTPRPSHSRSPSSNSNFYVHPNGDTPQQGTYDTATIRSNTSDSSSSSVPWTTKLRKIIQPNKKEKHHQSKNSVVIGGSSFDDSDASPKAHLIKNPNGDGTSGRFYKNNENKVGWRHRGRSVGPDSTTTTPTSASTTPSTPHLRPSTGSFIDPDQVIAFPKSPMASTSPMTASVPQFVTEFPPEPEEAAPTIVHARSKSNDVNVVNSVTPTREYMDLLANKIGKLEVVNNPSYVGFGKAPIAKPESSLTPEGPFPTVARNTYDKLTATVPTLPTRPHRSTDIATAPPITRPRTSTTPSFQPNVSTDKSNELPTTLAPGFKSSRSLSSGYLTLDSTASRTPSPKPPPPDPPAVVNQVDCDMPTSAAPLLQRPTTLKLHPQKPVAAIRRADAYVQIKGNTPRRN